ncbi:hypothetical protein BJ123_1591 [Rhodopseudomonas thermotolerans]|uniref:Uncharacterized protein n=3 Tax=Nitrobacteraceae TaxID=41294 RepID=A0A336JZP8_9BRAD|nr:hypothetical protein BJ125_1594 [Rhodopseudomonas pentothenatexigens]REF86811.1 hypothetical protein BJ123_1591 [Rhodopseudomonas thermotolerans]SSW93779.1 hypothetical protein SAMN05892882_1594 [Rhodopseudomonas pentothenatexigens]
MRRYLKSVSDRSVALLGAWGLIAATVIFVTQLRNWGFISSTGPVPWMALALNLGVSAIGLATPERGWWIANAILSTLAMLLIGASTIPSAIIGLVRLFWN